MSYELRLPTDPLYQPYPGYEHCSCNDCAAMQAGQDYRQFLSAFFRDDEEIRYRAFPPKNSGISGVKKSHCGLGYDVNQELQFWNRCFGIYFVVNAGGDCDADIQRYTAFFCECDSLSLDAQNYQLDHSPVPTSIRVETKKSIHAYWLIEDHCSETEWRDVQARLIQHFKADVKIKNPSRVMRLPGFDHISFENNRQVRKPVLVTQFHPHVRRCVTEMQDAFAPIPTPVVKIRIPELDKLNGWDELNERTRNAIRMHPTYHERGNFGHCQGVCHGGKGSTALFVNLQSGAYKCQSGCSGTAIRNSFGLPGAPERKK